VGVVRERERERERELGRPSPGRPSVQQEPAGRVWEGALRQNVVGNMVLTSCLEVKCPVFHLN